MKISIYSIFSYTRDISPTLSRCLSFNNPFAHTISGLDNHIIIFSLLVEMDQMQHTYKIFLNVKFVVDFSFLYSSCSVIHSGGDWEVFYPCQQMKSRTRKINNACQKLIQQWHRNVEKRKRCNIVTSTATTIFFPSLLLVCALSSIPREQEMKIFFFFAFIAFDIIR